MISTSWRCLAVRSLVVVCVGVGVGGALSWSGFQAGSVLDDVEREWARQDDLDAKVERYPDLQARWQVIAQGLLQGHLTLPRAAAQARELMIQLPDQPWKGMHTQWHHLPEEERYYRLVISAVESELVTQGREGEAQEVVDHLISELEILKSRGALPTEWPSRSLKGRGPVHPLRGPAAASAP